MTGSLRLIADDLTGALDTAAEFTGLCGAIDVAWTESVPDNLTGSLAIDTGTRECGDDDAAARVGRVAAALDGAAIAYKKVDSLMRGPWAAELAACLATGQWTHCVLAPAFPYQHRRTVDGRQVAQTAQGDWVTAGADLMTALAAAGLRAVRAQPGAALPTGIAVFDAATDADLAQAVAAGRAAAGPVLWCGSGGLARALAQPHQAPVTQRLAAPVLGLFGSDQEITAAQLRACGVAWIAVTGADAASAATVGQQLAEGVALVSVDLPPDLARAEAALRIADTMDRLLQRLPRPQTLIVAGGETLKGLCLSLGAHGLRATGQVMPGVPRSILRGGRWDGLAVVSKSGAFGAPDLWRNLLQDNSLHPKRIEA